MKFNGDLNEISWKDILWASVLLVQITYFIAVQPQKIVADCTTRFAQKIQVDKLAEDISYMRGRVDKITEILGAR